MITEIRLVVELPVREAVKAAAALLEEYLDTSMPQHVTQTKIVTIIPGPTLAPDSI